MQIGGSGDVILTDFDVLKCRIGGGDLKADKIGEAELAISGAGNVELNEVTIRFEAHVSGAGDISVSGGNIDEFKAEISGAGYKGPRFNSANRYLPWCLRCSVRQSDRGVQRKTQSALFNQDPAERLGKDCLSGC